ncbi:thioredoxin [Candidatus Woesebacteria bacterium]|nr:thioredoxin [Candidatus Woesebacteria bacterium]
MAVVLTKDNFEQEVLKSNIPVLVDFWAPWCNPCKIVEPTVDEIGKDFASKIKVGKVNVDEHQELAANYGVMSIPTFMLFKGGNVMSQFIGAQPKQKFEEEIKKVI